MNSSSWEEIQREIWDCSACGGKPRIQLSIRQQTEALSGQVKLLVVAVAPPFHQNVFQQVIARSVTNSPNDPLRQFLEMVFRSSWSNLTAQGLAVLHAVKCAVIPNEEGFQNPSQEVIDTCVPRHFAQEFIRLKPPVVIALGRAAKRAVIKVPGCKKPTGLTISGPLEGEHSVRCQDYEFTLIVTKFPRGQGRHRAQMDLERAAVRAGVLLG